MKWFALIAAGVFVTGAVAQDQHHGRMSRQERLNRGTRPDELPRAQSNIRVIVDGDRVAFADQGPVMDHARVLVPLRGVFEQLGATVEWHAAERMILAQANGKTINIEIGKAFATIDGTQVPMDTPARVVRDRAMVPLRFLSEALGATVDWRAAELTVIIHSVSR